MLISRNAFPNKKTTETNGRDSYTRWQKGNVVVRRHEIRWENPKKMDAARMRSRHCYELVAVLDRALLSPRKCRDLDLERADLALLVLLRLLWSSSSSSRYLGLWIL